MEPKSKKQKRQRRQFTDEFKAGAARLVIDEGKSLSKVSEDLDLTPSSLGKWVEQARADGGRSKRGTLSSAEKEELARLRKEVRVLRIERSILKKAAAFFAKENA
jgi:transposase